MAIGEVVAAAIGAAAVGIPLALIMRWAKHRGDRTEEKQQERQARHVSALAEDQRERERRLEESLKAGSLFKSESESLGNGNK